MTSEAEKELVLNTSNSQASNASGDSKTTQQDFINYPQPLIGLKFITEVQNPTDQSSLFYCELCNDWLEHHTKFNHVISTKHRFEAIRKEDPEWARNLEESSQSQTDLAQRILNAAVRVEMNLGRDVVSMRSDHNSGANNNNYSQRNSGDDFIPSSYKGRHSPEVKDIQPVGSMGFMASSSSTLKQHSPPPPHDKYFRKSYKEHWQHDDRSNSPPSKREGRRRNRSISSSRYRSRSRSVSLDLSREGSSERSRERYSKYEYRNKSPRPFSRVYSPERSESPKDISDEIEEIRRRQQRRAEEKRRAEERKKRHAERERREQEDKRRKEKLESKSDKSLPPPKPPAVLDEDTKRLVMQNLTELAKCCVTNEADAELALQVSNALTQAILQYRMRNMPETLVQNLVKTSNVMSAITQSTVNPLANNAIPPSVPSMQQYMSNMQNQAFNKTIGQQPSPFAGLQQIQQNIINAATAQLGNQTRPPIFNQLLQNNNQPQSPASFSQASSTPPQMLSGSASQPNIINGAIRPGQNVQPLRMLSPNQLPLRLPTMPPNQAKFPLGPPTNPTGQVPNANDDDAGLLQQIRHLIKQSIVEQQQEEQMQQQQKQNQPPQQPPRHQQPPHHQQPPPHQPLQQQPPPHQPPHQPPQQQSTQSHPPHSQPQLSQPPHSQPPHSQPPHSQPQHHQPLQIHPPHSQPIHNQPPHNQPPHIQPPHGQPLHSQLPPNQQLHGQLPPHLHQPRHPPHHQLLNQQLQHHHPQPPPHHLQQQRPLRPFR